jgi:hypothetical protein
VIIPHLRAVLLPCMLTELPRCRLGQRGVCSQPLCAAQCRLCVSCLVFRVLEVLQAAVILVRSVSSQQKAQGASSGVLHVAHPVMHDAQDTLPVALRKHTCPQHACLLSFGHGSLTLQACEGVFLDTTHSRSWLTEFWTTAVLLFAFVQGLRVAGSRWSSGKQWLKYGTSTMAAGTWTLCLCP